MKENLRKILESSLPPIVPRAGIREKYGVPYSDGHMANLDSMGIGPGAVRIGRRVCYEKTALIAWLLDRLG